MFALKFIEVSFIACLAFLFSMHFGDAKHQFGNTMNSVYCSLCSRQHPHIGCNHNGQFAENCPEGAELVKMTPKLKTFLLAGHNYIRNKVAGGEFHNHSGACRMATLGWDPELEVLAELNVKKCHIEYDTCSRTAIYKYSGQNIGIMKMGPKTQMEGAPIKIVKKWIMFGTNVTRDQLQLNTVATKTFHGDIFADMVVDTSSRMGCAAATYPNREETKMILLLTCNYARAPIRRLPVYEECKAVASGCQTGTDPVYTNLCSKNEVFAVNEIVEPLD